MRKPLVYYCFGIIIGYMSGLLVLEKYFLGAALIAASFLICIFLTIEYKKFYIIILIFTCISFANYLIYFQRLDAMEGNITIRLKTKSEYSNIGEYKGKLLSLKGNLSQFEEGDLINIKGSFVEEPIYDKGIVGIYKISFAEKKRADYISKMQEFKRSSYKKYKELLGEERAGILLATCFGDVSYIKSEEKEKYNRLGILHVVSVSGLHLAIIYKLLEGVAGLKVALPFAFIYVLFTGGEPATWRAFIMIFILKISKKVFKNYDSISSLALSAMLLLFYKPYFITDIGFNLSFLSMLGIFLTYKIIRNKLMFLPRFLNEPISLSLSAQFLSAPYIIATLNNFSIGFIFGNLFLLPLFSALVIVGNISIIFIIMPNVFSIICKFLKLIFIAIEGGIELILPITPEVLQVSYLYSSYIAIIYISYLLFKAGKRKYLYMPIVLVPLLFLENYKVIPEIDYVRLNFDNCIIFKYKTESMLILDKNQKSVKEDIKFLKLNKIDKIFVVENYNENIKVGEYTLTVIKSKNKGFIGLIVKNRLAIKALIYDKEESYKQVYKKYDIMNLNFSKASKKYDVVASIRILFGRYYFRI